MLLKKKMLKIYKNQCKKQIDCAFLAKGLQDRKV